MATTDIELPTIEPSMVDVMNVLERLAHIGVSVQPLLSHEVKVLFRLWCVGKRGGRSLRDHPLYAGTFSEKALHELASPLSLIASQAVDLIMAIQPVLAAHDRLHVNQNLKEQTAHDR